MSLRATSIMTMAAALCLTGPGALTHAQGVDINDLLRGGPGTAPEVTVPVPATPPPAGAPTDWLRGASPRPEVAEEVSSPLPAAPPVHPFPEPALIGTWAGIGTPCADRTIRFEAGASGYLGSSVRTSARDGFNVTARIAARHERTWTDGPHPLDDAAYFSFARQYSATLTRQDARGTALDGPEGWPLTLLLSRDADGGYVLRFAEPVTVCVFAREAE